MFGWKFQEPALAGPDLHKMMDGARCGLHTVLFQQDSRDAGITPSLGAAVADEILVRDKLGLKGRSHGQSVTG